MIGLRMPPRIYKGKRVPPLKATYLYDSICPVIASVDCVGVLCSDCIYLKVDTAVDYLVDKGYMTIKDAFDCSLSGDMCKVASIIRDVAVDLGRYET